MNKWDKYIESDETTNNPDWYNKYAEAGPEQDKTYQQYKTPEKTREELSEMSLEERYHYAQDLNRERNFLQSKGFTKGVLSGATLGLTEHIPQLKPQEHELNKTFGGLVGMTLPYGGIHQIISTPFKALNRLAKGAGVVQSKLEQKVVEAGISGLTGMVGKTGEQIAKGEGLNVKEIAEAGGEFVLFHGAAEGIAALFRASKKAINWLRGLKPEQEANLLVEGIVPNDISPDKYKTWTEEVVPELQANAKKEYEKALQQAIEKNNLDYKQKLANVQAEHEGNLYEIERQNEILKQEYEATNAEIEKANQEAIQEFEDTKKAFEDDVRLNNVVKNSIPDIEVPQNNLKGRVKQTESETGFEINVPENDEPIKKKIGSIFSEMPKQNTYQSGLDNVKAIRILDEQAYKKINEAYSKARQLNEGIEQEQSLMTHELVSIKEELSKIAHPSPPQKQAISAINDILKDSFIYDEAGNSIGFKPINNQILLDQAKALRYYKDYDFAHGDSGNIFNPIISALEEAAERSATAVGKKEAYEATKTARGMYKEWAETFNSDYIRPYRDVTNKSYSSLYNSSLNVDNFIQVDNILSKTNASKQLSNRTKRDLINKHLDPFLKDPRKADAEKFYESLDELKPIMSNEERKNVKDIFNESRKGLEFQGKYTKKQKVKPPKLKEKVSLKQTKYPTSVKIPLKPEVKVSKAMRAASDIMNIKPEEAINLSNSQSGLKKLKRNLNEKLYDKIGKEKVKDILYGGNVERKFNGKELYDIINKGENYSLLSEILGEEATADLLVSSKEIQNKALTVQTLKNVGTKITTIKALLLFGII